MTAIQTLLAHAPLMSMADARKVIRSGKPHYVYVLCRSDGTPFYVGKGVGERAFCHEADARNTRHLTHKLNVIRSIRRRGEAVLYRIESAYDEESPAHERERYLIQQIGRHDLKRGPLTNQTDGGEGASNPSEESRQRRRDSLWGEEAEDPERQIANRYFQRLTGVQSVTLKPLRTWKKAEALWQNRAEFGMSARQAATLVASAIANRVLLEPGALIPRRLHIEGTDLIIENGVGRDMLSSRMVTLADDKPTEEILRLTEAGFRYLVENIDSNLLVEAGILSPEE